MEFFNIEEDSYMDLGIWAKIYQVYLYFGTYQQNVINFPTMSITVRESGYYDPKNLYLLNSKY